MLYVLMCRYRNSSGKWISEVYPMVFDNAEDAGLALAGYGERKRAMAWIIETPVPELPPFKLVPDPEQPQFALGELDADGTQYLDVRADLSPGEVDKIKNGFQF